MTTETQRAAGMPSSWAQWVLVATALLVIVVSCIALIEQCTLLPPDRDEIEHAVAAWRLWNGERLYIDYFEHHPAYHYWFLASWFERFGESHDVLLFARAVNLICIAGAIVGVAGLGTLVMNREAGLVSAALFAASQPVAAQGHQARPDGPMLLLGCVGAWLLVLAWRRGLPWLTTLLAGGLLGMSAAIHPRSAFLSLAVGLALLWCNPAVARRRFHVLLLAIVCGLVPIVFPFGVFGVRQYFRDVYVVSTHVLPSFPPTETLKPALVGTFALAPAVFVALVLSLKQLRTDDGDVLAPRLMLLAIVLPLLGTLMQRAAWTYHYVSVFCAWALAGGFVLERAVQRFGNRAYHLAALTLLLTLAQRHDASASPQQTFLTVLDRASMVRTLVPPDETYDGSLMRHSLFRRSALWHWFELYVATHAYLKPKYVPNALSDLKRARPYALEVEGIIYRYELGDTREARLMDWVNNEYVKSSAKGIYLRKDVPNARKEARAYRQSPW